jgi:hypothetical protein
MPSIFPIFPGEDSPLRPVGPRPGQMPLWQLLAPRRQPDGDRPADPVPVH